ncbi:MAG TPA: hypothetical protein VNP92_34500 [Actinophytocola sp.]|nr:hypothetical protein [Actinophytocola sp.]
MSRWQRVAPAWGWLIGTGFFTALGLALLLTTASTSFPLEPSDDRLGVVLGLVFLVLWTLAAWRLNRMGLFIGDGGIRIRDFAVTQTLPWRSIAMIEDRPMDTGVGMWASRMLSARAIWVVLENGEAIQTTLAYRGTRVADSPHESRLTSTFATSQAIMGVQKAVEGVGMTVSERQCRAALLTLRQALTDSRR